MRARPRRPSVSPSLVTSSSPAGAAAGDDDVVRVDARPARVRLWRCHAIASNRPASCTDFAAASTGAVALLL